MSIASVGKLSSGRRAALLLAFAVLLDCGGGNREFDPASNGGDTSSGGATAGAATSGAGARAGAPSGTAGHTSTGAAGSSAGHAGSNDEAGSSGGPSGGADNGGNPANGGASSGTGNLTAGSGNAGAPGAGAAGAGACTTGCSANGAVCSKSTDCQSARCVDGVCCSGPCDGQCQACSAALTGGVDGVCSSVKKGIDPHDDCATEAASSCGQTGACGSNGVCALYDTSTVCVAASCTAGSAKSAQKCDGAGTCKAATTAQCNPYLCGAGACLTSCSKNGDCISGQVCVAAICRAPSDLLGACDEAADCAKGACIGGLCGLSIKSVIISGAGVSGGGSQVMIDGWFKTDANGHNLVRVSTLTQGYLYQAIDQQSILSTPLPPKNYLVITGQEGSNPLTRNFQFNLSDGSSVTKSVSASSSAEILLTEGTGDPFMLFEWDGKDITVLAKTY